MVGAEPMTLNVMLFHHRARPHLQQMGVLRLAGLSGQRDRSAWELPRPMPPLCPVHPGRDCRRRTTSMPRSLAYDVASQAPKARTRPPAVAALQPGFAGAGKASPGERSRQPSLPPDRSEKVRTQLIAELEGANALAAWRTERSPRGSNSSQLMPRRWKRPSLPGWPGSAPPQMRLRRRMHEATRRKRPTRAPRRSRLSASPSVSAIATI
jgi:hypothetical protein